MLGNRVWATFTLLKLVYSIMSAVSLHGKVQPGLTAAVESSITGHVNAVGLVLSLCRMQLF